LGFFGGDKGLVVAAILGGGEVVGCSGTDLLTEVVDLPHAELQELTKQGDSVYFNGESFFCSQLSCGGAIETCEAVMSGKVKNAIAVIRPPGHHAEPHKAMGFCLFNNVCVATKVMQQKYPDQCKKVLILDW
jgi:histone deacetylase 6